MIKNTGKELDKILIGSAAINYHDKNILQREAVDEDYLVMNIDEQKDLSKDYVDGTGILDEYDFSSNIASINEVYTLKVSHSPWIITPASWQKHIHDIKALKDHGAVLIPKLHNVAYKQWEIRKGKKNVNLNQDKTEFFGSNVRREYDHDSVHASIAFFDEPLYMKILADNSEVKTSYKKFNSLTFDEKKKLVQEETMVLSLERDLIPRKEDITKMDYYTSYTRQLQLLITQYSKGWFPQWIIENYYDIVRPPLNYWEKFNNSNKK